MTDLPTIQLECKKDGLQQLQNGSAKLTLTVNADDINAAISALWAAPMGTRYQVVMVEISDDDAPVDRNDPQPGDSVKSVKGYAKAPMTESQRCALLCADRNFQIWIEQRFNGRALEYIKRDWNRPDTVSQVVRDLCGVKSRSEIDHNPAALGLWEELRAQYEQDAA